MVKILKEFKEFAIKGNVVDMGVGVVVGAAITSVINSLVNDIFTPLVGLFTVGINSAAWFVVIKQGEAGGPYNNIIEAQSDGAIFFNLGSLFNAVISFLIVAIVLFFIVRAINRIKRPSQVVANPVDVSECPYCFSIISSKASRCPYCTSEINKR